MLPIARVSLPWRIQMIELNFSGSSVAMGAMTSASRTWLTPSDVATCPTASTKATAPTTISPSATSTWRFTIRRRGEPSGVLVRPRIEAMESQRRQVLDVDRRVGLEVALDIPAVDHEQRDRDDELRPRRVGRQEDRGGDGDAVGEHEGPDVRAEDLRVDRHDVAGRPTARRDDHREAGHEHRQRREHERRPEDRADADIVRVLSRREQDRDDRDHRLGQRGADGREHGADRALGEAELPPEPLDAVGEQLGAARG